MKHSRTRVATAIATCVLMVGACGSDRDSSDTTTTVAAVTTTAPATTDAASPTQPTDNTDTTSPTTDDSTDSTDDSTDDTASSSTADTTPDTTTAPTDAAPTGPMFGDAPWPCGPGTGANADDGTEVGVTADAITIAGGDDSGYPGAPGLDHEASDAIRALVAECNELGGINGRTITWNYLDAALFNVPAAIQAACDGNTFFLVGEAYAFDSNQEETRLACGLPAVPTFAVSAAFSMGKDVYQGIPNPADETPSGYFALMAQLEPEAIKNVATVAAQISSTLEPRDKTMEVAPQFGWGFSSAKLESNPVGEADWTPFVKQIADAGSTAVYYVGTCLPAFQLFKQAADANGLDIPMFVDTNFYEASCTAANSDGALDDLYLHMSYIPFEEADVNPATQDYLDLLAASGGDTSLIGAQATSSFLLWATAAAACGDTLTRACTLENLANTHSWTGHGLHAEGDPGGNHPPKCQIVLQLEGSEYVRILPKERGAYACDDAWVSPVVNAPAVAAALIDENRISQQFTPG